MRMHPVRRRYTPVEHPGVVWARVAPRHRVHIGPELVKERTVIERRDKRVRVELREDKGREFVIYRAWQRGEQHHPNDRHGRCERAGLDDEPHEFHDHRVGVLQAGPCP